MKTQKMNLSFVVGVLVSVGALAAEPPVQPIVKGIKAGAKSAEGFVKVCQEGVCWLEKEGKKIIGDADAMMHGKPVAPRVEAPTVKASEAPRASSILDQGSSYSSPAMRPASSVKTAGTIAVSPGGFKNSRLAFEELAGRTIDNGKGKKLAVYKIKKDTLPADAKPSDKVLRLMAEQYELANTARKGEKGFKPYEINAVGEDMAANAADPKNLGGNVLVEDHKLTMDMTDVGPKIDRFVAEKHINPETKKPFTEEEVAYNICVKCGPCPMKRLVGAPGVSGGSAH